MKISSGNLRYILAFAILCCVNVINATLTFNNDNARFILKKQQFANKIKSCYNSWLEGQFNC